MTPHASLNNVQLPVRRVGSISAGITLIVFGIVLLCSMFISNFNYEYLLRFTPSLLIVLGIEIIASSRQSDKYAIKYDFASLIMCFCVVTFVIFAIAASMHI